MSDAATLDSREIMEALQALAIEKGMTVDVLLERSRTASNRPTSAGRAPLSRPT